MAFLTQVALRRGRGCGWAGALELSREAQQAEGWICVGGPVGWGSGMLQAVRGSEWPCRLSQSCQRVRQGGCSARQRLWQGGGTLPLQGDRGPCSSSSSTPLLRDSPCSLLWPRPAFGREAGVSLSQVGPAGAVASGAWVGNVGNSALGGAGGPKRRPKAARGGLASRVQRSLQLGRLRGLIPQDPCRADAALAGPGALSAAEAMWVLLGHGGR